MSKDSTLLQRMGFVDTDRRSSAHDVACVALATNPMPLMIALRKVPEWVNVSLEVPLQKGDGKYATTVGFMDALVEWKTTYADISCRGGAEHFGKPQNFRCPKCVDVVGERPHALVVEVKTRIDGVGDLLRQMNLYREYKPTHRIGYGDVARTEFAIWSLDATDAQYTKLLAGQGYQLLVGLDLATIRGDESP